MKLINRKTNEMAYFGDGIVDLNKLGCKNVAEMIEAGWEDYEEPEEYYFIADFGGICARDKGKIVEDEEDRKAIGNYFETKEEAEKAVEKLKAWKRLKDKGFRFEGWEMGGTIWFDYGPAGYNNQDFNLLFGGEE